MKEIIIGMRPRQWAKNIAVFAALLFSISLFNPALVIRSILGFVYFCLISGMAYLLNDIYDLESDKVHPVKSTRPIASGKLKAGTARNVVFIFTPVIIISCALWSWHFAVVLAAYFFLQILYSTFLKHLVLFDILSIAASFVLRVISGAIAIGTRISSWLLFCTVLLSLFISLCKRRHEIILLKESGRAHRKILNEYNVMFLDQLISLTTSTLVICYILYTMSPDTLHNFGNDRLKYSTIFVLYGIFRYLYLTYTKNLGGSPEDILITDKPFLINLLLYAISCAVIIYF